MKGNTPYAFLGRERERRGEIDRGRRRDKGRERDRGSARDKVRGGDRNIERIAKVTVKT